MLSYQIDRLFDCLLIVPQSSQVTCEHSDLHGPVVTFKVPVYDKKRLKLAGFESRQDAVDLVSVISGLCDVHRR